MAEQGSSTKQLVPTLGFGDLMGAAVGQIIGAGIMSLMPAAIATTGRSVFLSFLVAAVLTCCTAIPAIFITSVVKLRGGIYTQLHMVGGDLFAGMYVIIYIMSNMSVSMYGLSLASYLTDLFQIDASWDKWIALVILTVFLILNLIGLDVFAKVQNLLVIVLIASLIMFGVMGIGKVNWSTYFNHDQYWMPNGVMGMLEAGGLLVFATGGATTILNYGSEAKNPTRDMPLVIIISTLAVAVMYAILSIVAAGVLPYEQVAGKNLTVVASHIMPQWGYYVFIIGGAGCALASTLNNSLASKPKPMMQMCDDGWLPQSFAALNKKKVPYKIQLFLYVVAVICTVSGLSIAVLGKMTQVAGAVSNVIIAWGTMRIPKLVPEAWAKSKFKVPQGVLNLLCIFGAAGALFNGWLNIKSLDTKLMIFNIVIIIVAFIFGYVRSKTVHPQPSYEVLD